MRRGLFVTGTGTGVGKTVTCAALLARYPQARYWKPVQTGIEQDDDTDEVVRLTGCAAVSGIRLQKPVSPHLAARWSGVEIRIAELLRFLPDDGPFIVEGAGGALVPLNDQDLMIDLMSALGMPVLVTAHSGLGTINHTLLTVEALRARSLRVAGVVFVGEANADNRAAIEHYGRVAVIGEMPRFDPLKTVREWAVTELDRQGRLAEWLR